MNWRPLHRRPAIAVLAVVSVLAGCSPRPLVAAAREQSLHVGSGPLSAGSATVTITPGTSVYLAGAALGRKSTGVHDHLYARCLIVDNGQASVGLVALDLIGFFLSDVESVRERLAGEVDHVVVAATHNHSGPDVLGLWGPSFLGFFPIMSGRDDEYVEVVKAATARCIREAKATRERVTVRLAALHVSGFSENIRRPGLKDNELTVALARPARSGRTIAVLYNFAAHPEIFLEGALITADFPYFVNAAVERELGGTAIFVNGAIGGLITVDLGPLTIGAAETMAQPTFDDAERVSQTLAAAVIRAARTSAAEVDAATISIAITRLLVPVENTRFRLARRFGVLRRPLDHERVETELDVIDIGPAQIATVPGEILPEIGFAVKAAMSRRFKFLNGLGNDELGYILRASDWKNPLYSYERTMSVGPSAAAVEDVLIRMLTSSPGSPVSRE